MAEVLVLGTLKGIFTDEKYILLIKIKILKRKYLQ